MPKFFVLAVLALLLSLPAHAGEQEPIKIGVGAPLTGELAEFGEDVRAGIDLAVQDINAKGGLLGRKLQPMYEDDGASPRQGVTVANRFVSEKVAAVVNIFSPVCMATASIYAEENIPFLNECNTDQITAKGWPNVIRVYPRNAQEAPKIAQLLAQQFKGKRLALIYTPHEYENDLAEGVMKLLESEHHTKPDAVHKLPENGDDFSAIITRLKDERIEVIYLGLFPKAAGLFLRQAAMAGYRPQIVGNTAYIGDDIVRIAGRAADGVVFATPSDPDYRPSARPVVEALAAKNFKHRPIAVYAYVLMQVYADAVLKTLKSETFDTIMGPISFSPKGDVVGLDLEYYRWFDGKFAPWKP